MTKRLNNWPSDWLTDRLTYWMTKWLNNWPSDWLTDRMTYWMTKRLNDCPSDWLTDRLTDRPENRLAGRPTDLLTERLAGRRTDRQIHWLIKNQLRISFISKSFWGQQYRAKMTKKMITSDKHVIIRQGRNQYFHFARTKFPLFSLIFPFSI